MISRSSLLALASTISVASTLGINCQGSGLCVGNGGSLGEVLGILRGMDPNQQFSDGQQIACVESPNTVGNPSLCVFYQKTGRTFTVDQNIWYVQALIDHGCGACGSVPVDEGNDVNNGELTANMVTNARRGMDMVKVIANSEKRAIERAETKAEGVSKLSKRLGINCNGSSSCGVGGIAGTERGTIDDLRNTVAGGDDGLWGEGQQIACISHATGRLCAFYQNVGDRTFNKDQTLMYMQWLLDHGCDVCGSVPTDDGNDVNNGELTVNFVA
ncbi:hypothetical protein CFAM422_012571 [Trichoderma lentiforme]|uniref:Killer toxin Kp4 domain-containing protein n=1 Tax=Trichoderma lentiforme TaxID=1567552 RepID=A0A9P5C865_9HYPO|nr:hypothetical protein CFAM422_012571 [Trichoderma lentiforme]